jgi:uncharacterized protein (TIGR03067 family)
MTAAVLFGVVLAVAAPGDKEAPKKEAPSIVGEWDGEKNVRGGMERPIPDGGVKVTFTADGKLLFKEGNKDPGTGSYKVDATKSPGEIEITPPKEDGTLLGIFKIDGDTLTICLADKGSTDRPTKFESLEGTNVMLVTLKRVKK